MFASFFFFSIPCFCNSYITFVVLVARRKNHNPTTTMRRRRDENMTFQQNACARVRVFNVKAFNEKKKNVFFRRSKRKKKQN